MKQFSELVHGEMISYIVERTNFVEYFHKKNITDSMVYFAPKEGLIIVDERASEMYARYAGLHEAICCGKYAYLVPVDDDPIGRCARIDALVMAIMPATYRVEYSRKRVEMFSTLIERDLSPEYRESFERSLEFHKDFLKKQGGDL